MVQTNEVRYIYDGNLEIQWRDGNNLPTLTLTRGRDLSGSLQGAGGIGGLLARTDAANGQTAYFHADGNGNVTALVNAQQMLVVKYLYDPFGSTLSKAGPLAEANTYRFSSKDYHANSGLCYYGYRFYDSNLQRWLNRDPVGERGGINLFGFVGNDPVDRADLFGLYDPDDPKYHDPVGGWPRVLPPNPSPNPSTPHSRQGPSCLDKAKKEFQNCMKTFQNSLCLPAAYDLMHNALAAAEWSLVNSDIGPIERIAAYAVGWEIRLSTLFLAAFYGGGSGGCLINAEAAWARCTGAQPILAGPTLNVIGL